VDNFAPVKKGKERIHKVDNYVQFAYEQKEANCNHRIGRRFPADILVFLTFPRGSYLAGSRRFISCRGFKQSRWLCQDLSANSAPSLFLTH